VPLQPATASDRGATATLDRVAAYPQGVRVRVAVLLSDETVRRALADETVRSAAHFGFDMGQAIDFGLEVFGYEDTGTEGRATLSLRLADGTWRHEITDQTPEAAVATPGVYWCDLACDVAEWSWGWWVAPLPSASFEVHFTWDAADVPPLTAAIDGAAVLEAAVRARPPELEAPRSDDVPKRPQDLTVDDIPLARVSTDGPPSEAAWAEVVAFVGSLDLSVATRADDDPWRGVCELLGLFDVVRGPPTLNDAVLADVTIDGLYKTVSGGPPRPYPPA
jgi:hypothetical protein